MPLIVLNVTCLHIWLSDQTLNSLRAGNIASYEHIVGTQFMSFKLSNKAGTIAIIANSLAYLMLTIIQAIYTGNTCSVY